MMLEEERWSHEDNNLPNKGSINMLYPLSFFRKLTNKYIDCTSTVHLHSPTSLKSPVGLRRGNRQWRQLEFSANPWPCSAKLVKRWFSEAHIRTWLTTAPGGLWPRGCGAGSTSNSVFVSVTCFACALSAFPLLCCRRTPRLHPKFVSHPFPLGLTKKCSGFLHTQFKQPSGKLVDSMFLKCKMWGIHQHPPWSLQHTLNWPSCVSLSSSGICLDSLQQSLRFPQQEVL